MTVPVARDGTGERFTSTMGYDTGSNSLSIFQHELFSLFTHTGIQALRWALVEVAGGQHFLPECDVDLRILAENNERVLVDTHTVSATVIMEGSRLSSESLQRHFFVCTHPRTRRVYVAKNKTHLLRSHFMPAWWDGIVDIQYQWTRWVCEMTLGFWRSWPTCWIIFTTKRKQETIIDMYDKAKRHW